MCSLNFHTNAKAQTASVEKQEKWKGKNYICHLGSGDKREDWSESNCSPNYTRIQLATKQEGPSVQGQTAKLRICVAFCPSRLTHWCATVQTAFLHWHFSPVTTQFVSDFTFRINLKWIFGTSNKGPKTKSNWHESHHKSFWAVTAPPMSNFHLPRGKNIHTHSTVSS